MGERISEKSPWECTVRRSESAAAEAAVRITDQSSYVLHQQPQVGGRGGGHPVHLTLIAIPSVSICAQPPRGSITRSLPLPVSLCKGPFTYDVRTGPRGVKVGPKEDVVSEVAWI